MREILYQVSLLESDIGSLSLNSAYYRNGFQGSEHYVYATSNNTVHWLYYYIIIMFLIQLPRSVEC